MRMNRGTILLIAALLVVIVAVLVVNNSQNSNPPTTPTVPVVAGPILPGVTANNIDHYEVRDNISGNFTSLTKDAGGAWHIDGTNLLPTRVPDQSLITTTAGQIATINYNNTFQNDQLATFGLDKPAYSILAQTTDGKLFTVYIGSKAPTSSGYYAVVVTGTAQSTPEATTESGAAPQAIATENVASQAQNGSSIVPATAETSAATAEATAEATTAVAKKIFKTLAQATAEATAESTLDNSLSAQQNGSSPASTAVAASTAQAGVEVTAAVTAEPTAEATANVIHNPAVTLTGTQTIYVIPQTVIDTLTKWINTPPYAPLPTPAPTNNTSLLATEAPTLEPTSPLIAATPTASGAAATAQATAEATAAATAGS